MFMRVASWQYSSHFKFYGKILVCETWTLWEMCLCLFGWTLDQMKTMFAIGTFGLEAVTIYFNPFYLLSVSTTWTYNTLFITHYNVVRGRHKEICKCLFMYSIINNYYYSHWDIFYTITIVLYYIIVCYKPFLKHLYAACKLLNRRG